MSASRTTPGARCAIAGCVLPPTVGEVFCVDHKRKPLGLRESIAAGPRFECTELGEPFRCPACGAREYGDRATGLCLTCWRAWRWSSIREMDYR